MPKTIDYFTTPLSPWTYLGHDRFVAIAARHGASVRVLPMDLGKVFPVSGGLPLAKRAPQRQAYRLVELARWRDYLGLPLNLQPKFGAAPADAALRSIVAAKEQGEAPALALAGALLRARWAEERDISDPATLAAIVRACGLDPERIADRAGSPEVQAAYDACTQEAIDRQVFGAPTYAYRDALYWGQDRLDFLDRALAQ
jgi:2-hydroxychromene-2-carboxylate isomerase